MQRNKSSSRTQFTIATCLLANAVASTITYGADITVPGTYSSPYTSQLTLIGDGDTLTVSGSISNLTRTTNPSGGGWVTGVQVGVERSPSLPTITIPSINITGSIAGTTTNYADSYHAVGIVNYEQIINSISNAGYIRAIGGDFGGSLSSAVGIFNYGDDAFGRYSIINSIINTGEIIATSTNSATGITNGGTIHSITNLGTITASVTSPTTFNHLDINNNFGIIDELNNLQGVGNLAGALTYYGKLPGNYNIIATNTSIYGQLAVLGGVGSSVTTFGISSLSGGSGTVGFYDNIITGVAVGKVVGTDGFITNQSLSGTSNGYSYNLIWDGTNWDLNILSFYTGPTPEDTLASMQPNASALKNAFNSRYSALAFGLNHDCTIYDVNNLCVSAFGRRTEMNDSSYDNTAAGVVLGYKAHPQFRMGAYLDQSFGNNTTGGVNVERSNPDVGVFGVWNMNADGTGFELRAAANYGKRDLTVTRAVVGDTSAEAGRGKSDLNAYGALLEASYAIPMNDTWLAKPYAGVRYLSIKRDGYTESATDTVQNPLTYSNLKQETTSAVAGVRLNGRLAPKLVASLNAGFEHDLHHNIDDYRATGVDDLASINMNNQKDRTRPTAGLGISYDVADKQRISANVQYRKEIFMSESSVTGQVNYTIGF